MSIFHTILLVLGLLVGSLVVLFVGFVWVWIGVGGLRQLLIGWRRPSQSKELMMIGKCYACGHDLTGLPHSLRLRKAKDEFYDQRQRTECGRVWEHYRTCPECGHDESIDDYKYLTTCWAYKDREINLDDRR